MEVEEEVVFGGSGSHAIIEIDHFLVVTVHEVHLEAFHTHRGELLTKLIHIGIDGGIASPKYKAYVTLATIVNEFFQVDFRHHLTQVGFLVDGPSFVKNDVFNAVLRGKIDVVLISVIVDAALEIDTIDVPIVPPVPGDLAGLDPGDVVDAAGRSQLIDQVAVSQFTVVFRD